MAHLSNSGEALTPTPCGLVSLRSAPTAQPALPDAGEGGRLSCAVHLPSPLEGEGVGVRGLALTYACRVAAIIPAAVAMTVAPTLEALILWTMPFSGSAAIARGGLIRRGLLRRRRVVRRYKLRARGRSSAGHNGEAMAAHYLAVDKSGNGISSRWAKVDVGAENRIGPIRMV